jgi:3-carboxy-cis,cis-muconate cycloisomerase
MLRGEENKVRNLIFRRRDRPLIIILIYVCSFERLANETDIVGYPVLPLVNQLVEMCPKGDFIHWGATTQDIMDIASMLQMRKGLQIVRKQLAELIQTLTKLAHTYRDT